MKYILRALKYFFQISLTLAVILFILMALGLVSKDINVLFRGGWKSVEMIALMFAGVSSLYPLFGYARRPVEIKGEVAAAKETIDTYMRSKGFTKEKETPEGDIVYRSDSLFRRIINLGEDRISFRINEEEASVEGRNRAVMRIFSSLRYLMDKE
jgi:hypothetical protein